VGNDDVLTPPLGVRNWFGDPWSAELLRYWDKDHWTDHTMMAAERDEFGWHMYHPLSRGRPRHWAIRLLAFVGLMLVALASGIALTGDLIPRSPDGTGLLAPALAFGVFAMWAFLATRVDYRWFDALLLLVPIYSIFWVGRISWRITNLPYRDWPPAPSTLLLDPRYVRAKAESEARRSAAAPAETE
jgi:hypothetical protein